MAIKQLVLLKQSCWAAKREQAKPLYRLRPSKSQGNKGTGEMLSPTLSELRKKAGIWGGQLSFWQAKRLQHTQQGVLRNTRFSPPSQLKKGSDPGKQMEVCPSISQLHLVGQTLLTPRFFCPMLHLSNWPCCLVELDDVQGLPCEEFSLGTYWHEKREREKQQHERLTGWAQNKILGLAFRKTLFLIWSNLDLGKKKPKKKKPNKI